MMGNIARHRESSNRLLSPLPDLHAHDGGQLGPPWRLGPIQRHGRTLRRPCKIYGCSCFTFMLGENCCRGPLPNSLHVSLPHRDESAEPDV